MKELLDVDALGGQQEEDGEHRAVPGAVDEHGRQQVAGADIGKAQQEAQGSQLQAGQRGGGELAGGAPRRQSSSSAPR